MRFRWTFPVSRAASLMVLPMSQTASMLIPARVDATFTEAHTLSVVARASGMASMSARSPRVNPFSTRAPKPPMKSIPTSRAARSIVLAICIISEGPNGQAATAIGLTAMRLLTTGTPYLSPTSLHVLTRSFARRQILSWIFFLKRSGSWLAQSNRLIPSVTVLTSRCSLLSISRVESTSLRLSIDNHPVFCKLFIFGELLRKFPCVAG